MTNILSSTEQIKAKAWIHDILVWGGNVRSRRAKAEYGTPGRLYLMYTTSDPTGKGKAAAKAVFDFIVNRYRDPKDMKKVDEALDTLSSFDFYVPLDSDEPELTYALPKEEAAFIAWFCATNEIYWSSKHLSIYELDQIEKTTIGNALLAAKCFTHQEEDPEDLTTASTPAPTSTASGANQPKNNYKSLGGLSGKAVDLIGKPGWKTMPTTGNVYCISYSNSATSTPATYRDFAYIRPVEPTPTKQAAYTVDINGKTTNRVLFGKPQGYGYCTCYFDSLVKATEFLQKMEKISHKYSLPYDFSRFVLVKKKVQPNGYFEIGTEFGNVLISAAKLNEEVIEESLTEEENNNKYKFKLNDYLEGWYKDI